MAHATAIAIKTQATVLSTWRDDDGYGNVDADYITMTLQIPTWPTENTLLARIPDRDDPDKPPSQPVVNTTYNMEGEFFYNFPSKDWTRTYLHVDRLCTATASSIEQSLPPTFTLIAKILVITGSKVTAAWETFDPYEGALFINHAVLQFGEQAYRPTMAIGQRISVSGHADGDGRDQLIVEHSTVLAR